MEEEWEEGAGYILHKNGMWSEVELISWQPATHFFLGGCQRESTGGLLFCRRRRHLSPDQKFHSATNCTWSVVCT